MDFSKYDKRKLLLLLVFSLLVVQTVAAQNFAEMLENIPVLQGLTGDRIEKLYDDFWWLWDFAVYALILSTALKMGAQKALGDNAGKMGGIFAIVLSIGAVIAENQIGFNLKEFAALALAIGIFAFGLYMWRIVKGMGLGERGRLIMGILYLTIYALISPRLKGLRDAIGSMNWIISVADILAAVFVVLVVIDLISFVKGLKGGGGGDGGRGGVRPGSAAVATAEDQAALAEEGAEAKERAAEVAEEARELNDIRVIRSLTFNESKLWDGIKKACKKMIDALRKMVKAGRESTDLVEEVRTKVSEIVQYSSRINSLEQELRGLIGQLEQLEIAESRNINMMFSGTRKEISEEIVASKNSGWAGKAPNNAKWAQVKGKFEQDAKRRINEQVATVKGTLETHAVAVSKLERAFTNYFTQAEAFLRANDIPRAILQLEAAISDIDRIQAGLRALEGNDVNKIQGQIQRRLNDLKAETKAGTLNSIGIKRQIAGVKQAQAAGRGLKGLAGKPVTIVGKLWPRKP